MDRHNRIGLFLLILAVSIVACAPLLPAVPALPTQPVGALGTSVAGTRSAALTQTAYYITPSSTPTLTRTPTRTPTITPTATATIIFKYNSPVPGGKATATKSGGGGGGGGGPRPTATKGGGGSGQRDAYLCGVKSTIIRVGGAVVPGELPTVPAHTVFTVTWTVRNVGEKTWDHGSTDYQYLSGTLFDLTFAPPIPYLYDFPDIPNKIKPNEEVDLVVKNPALISPSSAGIYESTWILSVSSHIHFCKMNFRIRVP